MLFKGQKKRVILTHLFLRVYIYIYIYIYIYTHIHMGVNKATNTVFLIDGNLLSILLFVHCVNIKCDFGVPAIFSARMDILHAR